MESFSFIGGHMEVIYRGTTPIITLAVDEDLTGYEIEVTFESDDTQIIIDESRLEVEPTEDGCLISFELTQEETFSFFARADIQIRARIGGSVVSTAQGRFKVKDQLSEVVL